MPTFRHWPSPPKPRTVRTLLHVAKNLRFHDCQAPAIARVWAGISLALSAAITKERYATHCYDP